MLFSIRRMLIVFCGLATLATGGCADLDILPSWVPFQGAASDHISGVVTPAERIAELRKLSKQAAAASPEQRNRVSQQLVESIRTEKDPLIRVEIIRTLGRYPSPDAQAILKAALADGDAHVRAVVCEAWGKQGDAEGMKLLSDTLRSDVDADVRLAAARALGETKNPQAVPALSEALSDNDPAMQYRAVLSLQKVTGKDLGNDVERWRQYVKGEQPTWTPSLAERIRRWF